MNQQEYKKELITRLQAAGKVFEAVNNYYRSGGKDTQQTKELLGKVLKAMPTFGEAIAVIDAVPPRQITDLVRRNIVHESIVSEHQEEGKFIGAKRVTAHRLGDDLKVYYLHYLKGELSVENEKSLLYFTREYTFENIGRTCFSARNVCENVDSIDSRL